MRESAKEKAVKYSRKSGKVLKKKRESAQENAGKCLRKSGKVLTKKWEIAHEKRETPFSTQLVFSGCPSFLTCYFTGRHFDVSFSFAVSAHARKNVKSLQSNHKKSGTFRPKSWKSEPPEKRHLPPESSNIDTYESDSRGSDSRGSDSRGSDSRGSDSRGSDSRGSSFISQSNFNNAVFHMSSYIHVSVTLCLNSEFRFAKIKYYFPLG